MNQSRESFLSHLVPCFDYLYHDSILFTSRRRTTDCIWRHQLALWLHHTCRFCYHTGAHGKLIEGCPIAT